MKNSDTTPEKSQKQGQRRESVKKWSRPVLDAGFTLVPTLLLTKQDELGLDAIDVNILLQLACSWWKADKLPYLSKETLAKRIGVDPSTIRRRIAAMEKRRILKRKPRTDGANGQRSNFYNLRPLVELLHPLAVQATKEKKSRHARRRQGEAS